MTTAENKKFMVADVIITTGPSQTAIAAQKQICQRIRLLLKVRR
jgi:hypothetical protein